MKKISFPSFEPQKIQICGEWVKPTLRYLKLQKKLLTLPYNHKETWVEILKEKLLMLRSQTLISKKFYQCAGLKFVDNRAIIIIGDDLCKKEIKEKNEIFVEI